MRLQKHFIKYLLSHRNIKGILRYSEWYGYTLARTNINSCDFSSDTYTYVADNDKDLKTFILAHDEKYKIPFIKEVQKAANNTLKLYVSPWSPPAWMKDNNDMLHGGKLKDEFRQSWANYYIKFIKAYEAKECSLGIDVQNDPWQNKPGNPVSILLKTKGIL
jgi:glucosylceramidase